MIYAQLSIFLREISRFGPRNGFCSNFYSKAAPWRSSTTELCRRISPIGDPKVSIVPILDQWVEEGGCVQRESLIDIINDLRSYRRYSHALEFSIWMTDKRYSKLTSSGVAIRLDLIAKAQGMEQAEIYFNSVPQELKGLQVYGALLQAFATAKCVEKAETIMQKMNDIGVAKNIFHYNAMLNLYYKTGDMDKLDALLLEMEENGIVRDRFTHAILLSAYAAVMDIEKMDNIVKMLESDPKVSWTNYGAAAAAYKKAGLLDKAFEMLKQVEIREITKGYNAYNYLLTQYAAIGRKDEVLRVWSLYKKKYKVYNKGYSHVLKSLVMLGDFEMAKKIFDEWHSRDDLTYDMHIPNIMLGVYFKKDLLEKAKAILGRAILKGGKPNAWTWYLMVEGYLRNGQPEKAVEMMKKTIALLSGTEREPALEVASLKACLEYLKGVGDIEQTEEFLKLLADKDVVSLDELEEVSMDTNGKLKVNLSFDKLKNGILL